jgi:HSP20 family molecular chaperone IbpA
VVTAKAQHEARRQVGTVHIRELGSRRLFRRVELPSTIDVGKVTASLDDGVLRLVIGKSELAGARRQAVSDRAAA